MSVGKNDRPLIIVFGMALLMLLFVLSLFSCCSYKPITGEIRPIRGEVVEVDGKRFIVKKKGLKIGGRATLLYTREISLVNCIRCKKELY